MSAGFCLKIHFYKFTSPYDVFCSWYLQKKKKKLFREHGDELCQYNRNEHADKRDVPARGHAENWSPTWGPGGGGVGPPHVAP